MGASRAAQPRPVRAGDVYQYDATRVATIMRTRPGGIAEVRVTGKLNGKPSIRLGDYRVADVKGWPYLGRASSEDGYIFQVEAKDFLSSAPEPRSAERAA